MFLWSRQTLSGLEKLADKQEKSSYGQQVFRALPAVGIRSLSDVPAGALEAAIENRIVGTRKSAVGAPKLDMSPLRRGVGRASGSVAAIATAPLFFSGLQDAQSKDPETRRRGMIKAVAAGALGSVLKGGVEGGVEGGLGKAMARVPTKVLFGVPGAISAVLTAQQVGKKGATTKDKYLAGALLGGGAGLLKGGVEAAYERRGLWKTDRSAFKRSVLGRGLGRTAGGVAKGLVMTAVIDKLMEKKSSVLRFEDPRARYQAAAGPSMDRRRAKKVLRRQLPRDLRPKTAEELENILKRMLGQA